MVVALHRRPGRLGRLVGTRWRSRRWRRSRRDRGARRRSGGDSGAFGRPSTSRAQAHRVLALAGNGGTDAQPRLARLARAPLVAFTDDDCRPTPEWLKRMLAVAGEHPRGRSSRAQPYLHPEDIAPPRAGLERPHDGGRAPTPNARRATSPTRASCSSASGGFYEGFRMPFGEDVDLGWRARRSGAGLATGRLSMVHHAVEPETFLARLRWSSRWSQMALVVKRNPDYRRAAWAGGRVHHSAARLVDARRRRAPRRRSPAPAGAARAAVAA